MCLSFGCVLSATGQTDSAQTLVRKLNSYYNTTLQEKLFLHSDRSFYLTGETMWFKIYNVDACLNKPLAMSKVAYIDLLDKDKNPVIQKKISINGNGEGSIFIPASLSSGHYRLRAYTSWMKNFDADLYFQQTITIVNPFVKLGLKPSDHAKDRYDVQFFPEGGNLVDGIASQMAFRAVDESGHGIDCNVWIINDHDTITTAKPFRFGIGSFTFKPEKAHQYKAVMIDSTGKSFSYKLPDVLEKGYVLHLTDTTPNWISISVATNVAANQPVYLLMHTKQQVVTSEMKALQNGTASFLIDKSKIKEGISHIVLFDDKLTPVCERLYFKRPEQKIKIEIKPDLNQYAIRKKIKIDFTTTRADKPTLMDLSVAVYRQEPFQNESMDIETYLLLTSELKGTIESPAYYLRNENSEALNQAIDNLMLTHGWSRFKWTDMTDENYKFLPEIRSHLITGRVVDTKTNQPAKNIIAYLASPSKNIRLYLSKSNANGQIQFEVLNFYGDQDLILRTNSRKDSTYSIQLSNPFSEPNVDYKLPPFDLTEQVKTELSQRSLYMQIQNVFHNTEQEKTKTLLMDSSAFYGTPDKRYFLDDYTRFPTMEEVMREYVAEVLVRKKSGTFHFYNYDVANSTIFTDEPLVLIDGVPVFKTNEIMDFDPRKIKRLDVMTRRYFLGALSFPGIISYSTYQGDLGGFQFDSEALMLSYEGLQRHREFFSPKYETQEAKSSTIPDMRSLLFWSPTVKTGTNGKGTIEFYASDVTGRFNIVIQGLSNEGIPGYSIQTFEVKEKVNY